MNDRVLVRNFQFSGTDMAIKLMTPNCFMAKIDLRHAYRQIKIHPNFWEWQGFEWMGEYYVDTCLTFGYSPSPQVFSMFTAAIVWMARKLGISIVGYLDDFWITVSSYDLCLSHLKIFLNLLLDLGWQINWKKLELPTQRIKFLGIVLDSVEWSASMDDSKVEECLF